MNDPLPSGSDLQRLAVTLSTAATTEPALTQQLNQDLLLAIHRLVWLAPFPLAVLIFALVQSDASDTHGALVIAWCISMVGMHVLRYQLVKRWCRLEATALTRKIPWLMRVNLASALSMSSVGFFFPLLALGESALITLVSAAMVSGTLNLTNGRPSSFWSMALPINTMLSLGWFTLWIGNTESLIPLSFTLLLLVFCVFQHVVSQNTYKTYLESSVNAMQALESTNRLKAALAAAEAASQAKTRFLAAASHDLRQPLHTLSLLGGALMMRKLDEKSTKIAHGMNDAMRDLAAQLDTLLDISKLDAGLVVLSRESVSISLVLEHLRGIYSPLAAQKQLQIEFRHPSAPIVLNTDRQLLERLLSQLIDNAVKFTGSGSIIVSAEPLDGDCLITVADTGIGIAPEQQQRIFDEFYQIGNDARHRQRGLGLGLSIVQRLRKLLGAGLVLESSAGRGTRITLRFKIGQLSPTSPGEPQLIANARIDKRILIIDDEDTVRQAMRLLLEGMGATVIEAADTTEALQCARQTRPDLVLADLRLQADNDGIETIRQLREIHPQLLAMLISGDTAPEHLRKAADAGLVLLHKPLSAGELRSEILRQDNRPRSEASTRA